MRLDKQEWALCNRFAIEQNKETYAEAFDAKARELFNAKPINKPAKDYIPDYEPDDSIPW